MPQKKILLVDDSLTVLKLLETHFQKAGFITEIALDGIEAIAKAYQFMPDIIILDFIMPQLSGLSTCRFFKQKKFFKDIPIIILSTVEDKDKINWAKTSGATAFISKNTPPQELIATVNKILKESSPLKKEKTPLPSPPREEDIINEIFNFFEKQYTNTIFLDEISQLSSYLDNLEKLIKKLLKVLYYNFPSIFILLEIDLSHQKNYFLILPKDSRQEVENILGFSLPEDTLILEEDENIAFALPQLYNIELKFSKLNNASATLTFCFNKKSRNLLEHNPFFNILTKHLSILIEFALYHKKLEEKSQLNSIRLHTLVSIGKLLDYSVDTNKFLDNIVQQVKKMIGCEKVTFFLINPLLKKAFLRAHSENQKYFEEFEIQKNSVTDWVIKNKKPLLMQDSSEQLPENIITHKKSGNFICSPIITRNKILGTLNITNKLNSPFNTEDLNIVLALSKLIGTLLENKALFSNLQNANREMDRKIWEINALTSSLKALSSITAPLKNLSMLLEQIKDLLKADEIEFFSIERDDFIITRLGLSKESENIIKNYLPLNTNYILETRLPSYILYTKNKKDYFWIKKETSPFNDADVEVVEDLFPLISLFNLSEIPAPFTMDLLTGLPSTAILKIQLHLLKEIKEKEFFILRLTLNTNEDRTLIPSILVKLPPAILSAAHFPNLFFLYLTQDKDKLEKNFLSQLPYKYTFLSLDDEMDI